MDEELTLVFFKPGSRPYSEAIIKRFEKVGLSPAAWKFEKMTNQQYDEHYGHVKERDFYEEMREYMLSETIMFVIFKGYKAIDRIRSMIGPTRGAPAGTIRGDFGSDGFKNLIHASDSYESANKEIARFFYKGA